MLIFFKIDSITYSVEIQENPSVIQVLTAIQENCRERHLSFAFGSFSCKLSGSGQYLLPNDLGKQA